MSDRYYEAEHYGAYERLRREGLTQWSDLHEPGQPQAYEDFPTRAFLDRVLTTGAQARGRRVLEYGCGTGAAACFLAGRGFQVDAVDLVPDAIAMAREFAAARGLGIRFAVQDICRWPVVTDRFDYVIDSFCLQSIVTDSDRDALLAGVRRRLAPGGRFLISTAMQEPGRDYGDDHRDPSTGIVWVRVAAEVTDSVRIGDSWYVPNRRHLSAEALQLELERCGYTVLEQSGRFGGEIVAVHRL